jgi:phosphoribosylanthranilate isomerase
MWCKICGLTRVDDVLAAADAGADALGFNFFAASSRFIASDLAQELCLVAAKANAAMERVGLFVDPSVEQVQAVLSAVDLTMLQFHGDEPEDFCQQFGMPYIKVLAPTPEVDVEELVQGYQSAWALLLDAHDPQLKGGTGKQFDWSLWPQDQHRRLILAGGLDAENVAAAIRQTQPFGVDVASGVESAGKGLKDPTKVRRFIEAAKHG